MATAQGITAFQLAVLTTSVELQKLAFKTKSDSKDDVGVRV